MSREIPRGEHPRPDLYRPEWRSLNGVWRFSTDHERRGLDQRWFEHGNLREEIVVPFTYQHELSGIGRKGVEEVVWYARDFDVLPEWLGDERSLLLHFGAVDYRCVVWVNGIVVGRNEGGHVPFELDITRAVNAGSNLVVLRVEDPQDPAIPRGKQSINGTSHSIFYTCTTGIWQSVWLEPVSKVRIENLMLSTMLGDGSGGDRLRVRFSARGASPGSRWRLVIYDRTNAMNSAEADIVIGSVDHEIELKSAKRWSPEEPHLYDVKISLLVGGSVVDELHSYVGFRSAEARDGRFYLNGEPYYLKMVLDQGYWPESGLTAPTDDALKADVEWCKKFGFNGARKHQKIEDPRWLYWCDKLGLIAWGEMANAFAWAPGSAEGLTREWTRAVIRDRNHPCIVTWVPVNESWGVPYLRDGHPEQIALLESLVALTRELDGTRPVVDNDGWEHTDSTDFYTLHDYSKTGKELYARYEPTINGGPMQRYTLGNNPMCYLAKGASYHGQPVLLTEVGGFLSIPEGVPKEKWDSLYSSYAVLDSDEALVAKYAELIEGIKAVPFVCGFCYTQLTDVEQEANGLLTYSRVPKVSPEAIKEIHDQI